MEKNAVSGFNVASFCGKQYFGVWRLVSYAVFHFANEFLNFFFIEAVAPHFKCDVISKE